MSSHYISLICSYGVVVVLWFMIYRFFPSVWRGEGTYKFNKPILDFILAIIAVLAILGIGQLYIRNLLIPNDGNVYVDAVNQLIIFSPTLLLVFIMKQPLSTLWIQKVKIGLRLWIGLLLAFCALIVYWLTKGDSNDIYSLFAHVYHYDNLSHLVQVFMEDITIALVFIRLSAWIGNNWSIFIVALLFSAGHIPSMIANGASLIELGSLGIDLALGILVLTAVSRSRDILWFFMVHFAIDMTQFFGN